jgi:purine-binding chemotaxis protein CheW
VAEKFSQAEQPNRALLDKEGKYVTFALGPEEYGLEILKVLEIISYTDMTTVAQQPAYVKGVINLRGQFIPVIDLMARFGMENSEITEETCIIIVEINQLEHKFSTGIVVDQVPEVMDIASQNIGEAAQFASSIDTDFILGLGKIGENVKILLDIDKVLADEEFISFLSTKDDWAKSDNDSEEE